VTPNKTKPATGEKPRARRPAFARNPLRAVERFCRLQPQQRKPTQNDDRRQSATHGIVESARHGLSVCAGAPVVSDCGGRSGQMVQLNRVLIVPSAVSSYSRQGSPTVSGVHRVHLQSGNRC